LKKDIKISSNRSFGIVFFIFFLGLSFYPLLNENDIRLWAIIISIIFLGLALINSKILTPLNKIWHKFGILLGKIVSPIVMGVVFFTVVTPTSLIMKLLGKDILNIKKNKKSTYWIDSSKSKSKMKNQF
jgi:ABC-type Fe3+-siderophore transport system permease subunit